MELPKVTGHVSLTLNYDVFQQEWHIARSQVGDNVLSTILIEIGDTVWFGVYELTDQATFEKTRSLINGLR